MKKLLSALCALLGLLILGMGFAVWFVPEAAWAPIALLKIWRIPILVVGALVLIGGGVLLWFNRAKPPKADRPDAFVMASNEDLRARVRDLLKRAWGRPLLALVLGVLPFVVVHTAVHLLLQPVQIAGNVIQNQIFGSLSGAGLYLDLMVILSGGAMPDISGLIGVLPGIGVLLLALILVFEPMLVSRATYFMRLLRGRRPSPVEVYGVFGPTYPRALGGMAYRALWAGLWTVALIGIPVGLYVGGIALINAFPEVLNQHLLVLVPSLAGATIVAFAALAIIWVNRMLAYCMTPCVLSSQNNLSARKAVKASRALMQGHKCRVLGLWLSYLYYFIPAIVAGAVLLLLPVIGPMINLSEILLISLRRFSWVLVIANQLVLVYVLPLAYSSFHAFYLERKRELLDQDPAMMAVLGVRPRRES